MRSRSRVAAVLLLGSVATSSISSGVVSAGAPRPPRLPNVLLIVADDQRADTLEAMPRTRRAFIENGVSYSEAHVATPLCCPSRATIMTGRYLHNHNVISNTKEAVNRLRHGDTLQAYLQRAGYFTGISGKLFNKWDLERDPPFWSRWAIMTAGHRASFNVNGALKYPQEYSTTYAGAKAVDFLHNFERRNDDRPWFLYVTPFAPHTPFEPEAKYAEAPVTEWSGNPAVFDDRSDKPPYLEVWDQGFEAAAWERRQQLRMLRSVDDVVREVMTTLSDLNERNTIAIYTSDNGVFWGEHQLRQKHFPYTGATKVPLMMRWPGRLPRGETDDSLVSLVDIAPTILELLGLDQARGPMDGRPLTGSHERSQLLIEYERDVATNATGSIPRWRSIRGKDMQYSVYADDYGLPVYAEFYDLVSDPWQLTNLLGDEDPANDPGPYRQERLIRRIKAYSTCVGTTGTNPCP